MFSMSYAGGNMKVFHFYVLDSLLSSVCLTLQLRITLKKEDNDPEKNQYNEYLYAGGLVEYVKWLNTDKVCFSVYHLGFLCCTLSHLLAASVKL